MTIISNKELSWIERFALNVVKCGKIPRHIAIIMDGHRRYQRKTKTIFSTSSLLSHKKVTEFYRWCLELGVSEVTLLTLHPDNMQRPKAELLALSNYVVEAVKSSNYEEETKDYDIKIDSCGQLSEFSKDFIQIMVDMLQKTKDNNGMVLRAANAYTSRYDLTQSIRYIVKGVEENKLKLEDINAGLIEHCLEIKGSSPVDLFVRTGGRFALSDFATWTGSCSCIHFSTVIWHEYNMWEFLKAIFHYQRSASTLTKVTKMEDKKVAENERVRMFIEQFHKDRINNMIALISS